MNMFAFRKWIIVTAALFGGFAAPTGAADSAWVQVWSDECNGAANSAVDGSKWSMVNSGGGFGNSELQYYTNRTANSYYDGKGSLVIKTMKESFSGSEYTSAKLFSQNKGDWTYCKIEIRAKLPKGRCLWPAFWMMPTSSKYGGWPTGGEIDIMEERGDQPSKITSTLHFGNPHTQLGYAGFLLKSQTFDTAFHIFRMEWSEGLFYFYIDSNVVCRMMNFQWFTSAVNHATNPNAPFDQNFFLQINTAVGGPNSDYTGNQSPDNSVFPQYMYIDYVRVYKRVPLGAVSLGTIPVGESVHVLTLRVPGGGAATLQLPIGRMPAAGVLSILTLRGERVRTLDLAAQVNNQIDWDGNSDAGRPVGRGTYLVRVNGCGVQASGRIVVGR